MSDQGYDDSNALKRRKRKHRKAPEAPKKPLTPYIFYSKEMRDAVKDSLDPNSKVTDIIKAIANKWKALSEEEKEPYNKKASEDKDRYSREMDAYDGPMQIPINNKKNRKNSKHPDAPKRAMSPFLFFSKERRPQLKEQHADMKITEISTILGRMWRDLTDEEKLPYLESSKEDRTRYNSAQNKFKQQQEISHIPPPLIPHSIPSVQSQSTWLQPNNYPSMSSSVVYPRLSHEVQTNNNNYAAIPSNISIPYHFDISQNSGMNM
ncbi:hypothetical protein WA158_001290 [Blastocystis sp. Blastoise]